MKLCHCGSNATYTDCCGPFLARTELPPTAEALMRSRYSAFCEGAVDYLIDTRHPEERAQDSRAALLSTIKTTQWRALQVLNSKQDGAQAEVEFVAFYSSAAEAFGQIHERSRFRLDGRQWYYLNGTHLPPVKVQRNDPCRCGSGKKFKKCCGRQASDV